MSAVEVLVLCPTPSLTCLPSHLSRLNEATRLSCDLFANGLEFFDLIASELFLNEWKRGLLSHYLGQVRLLYSQKMFLFTLMHADSTLSSPHSFDFQHWSIALTSQSWSDHKNNSLCSVFVHRVSTKSKAPSPPGLNKLNSPGLSQWYPGNPALTMDQKENLIDKELSLLVVLPGGMEKMTTVHGRYAK